MSVKLRLHTAPARVLSLALVLASAVVLAPAVSVASGASQVRPWLDRALKLQYELSGDVGLRNAPFIGTHNSYNSVAEMGLTIGTSDPNQQLSIVDQLDLDMRALELDVHWFKSPSRGYFAPVVCHAFPPDHTGCSNEKTLGPVLGEIGAWLRRPAHSDQVLLPYLVDRLDNETGYDTAASTIERKLGDILYAPPAGGCKRLPLSLTRDRVMRAGKQVIIVGNTTPCGIGSAWPSKVFDWGAHGETRLVDFSDVPACGTDFTRAQYDSAPIRYYEDGRPSQAGEPRITPQIASQMARCGVDVLGLDQVMPDDPRLPALVWSWARGQPRHGRCAVQTSRKAKLTTRWKTFPCREHRLPACRKRHRWLLGSEAVAEKRGHAECRARHAKFAVPRTGYEAQLLRKAMRRAGVGQVWLGYRKRHGDWVALDGRAT